MISIAMCTYNGEKYIKEQLETLLNQTLKADEIIICDDGSKDDTCRIIEEFASKNNTIKLIKNNPGLGVFKNFEKAIMNCKGDYIFCCDQDDIWKLNKLEIFMQNFEDDTLLVFSNAAVVQDMQENYLYPLWEPNKICDYQNGIASFKNLVYMGGSIAGCCMAFRKELLSDIVPFPDGIYHDDWLATCAAIKGNIVGINQELIYYRQHSNNAVGIKRGNRLSYIKSRLTNLNPYLEHNEYIYQRHLKMFAALNEKEFVDKWLQLGFEQDLDLSKHRSQIRNSASSTAYKNAISDYKNDYYIKYSKGNTEFYKDLYDITLIKLTGNRYKNEN